MSEMKRFLTDMALALFAGLNAWAYASEHRPWNLGLAVALGIAALVRWPPA